MLSVVFLLVLFVFSLLVDVIRHPQKMKILNVVWPVTALYSGPLGLLAYYTIGRKAGKSKMMDHANMQHNDTDDMNNPQTNKKPFWQSVLVGALHCGSGCTISDIMAESFLLFIPVTLFGSTLYGGWAVLYVVAFTIGIIFQYFAIKPMKHFSSKEAIIAALKADTSSLTFWQIGMYG